MRRYFDAFVYTANWCCCQLALRVPLATFGKAELKPFAAKYGLTIETSDEHWIFDWTLDESEDYDRFAEEDGSGWMRRLAPLRDELLRGDFRPLYLGWLAGAGELLDDALEPELISNNWPGLSDLSPPQQALVEFLEIDPDMLAAAMAGSARMSTAEVAETSRVDEWLGEWSRDEMVAVLKLIALGQGHDAERQVRSRHAAWLKAQRPSDIPRARRRSVAELRELAQSASGARVEREAKARAKQEVEQRHQRETHLRRLMADADKHWEAINTQAQRGSASGYMQAVQALTDLAEAYELTSTRKEFERALRRFLVRHATRGALLRRLTEAGLWSG